MGKTKRMTCEVCGLMCECDTGVGLLHGDIKVVMNYFEGEDREKIQKRFEGEEYPLWDFSLEMEKCDVCMKYVSMPVFKFLDGETIKGKCSVCGSETEDVKTEKVMRCPKCESRKIKIESISEWD